MSDPDHGRFVSRLPSDTEPRLSSALASVFKDLVGVVKTLYDRLANTSITTLGDFLIGVKRTETGAVATTQHIVNQTRDLNAIADYGLVADGVTNNLAAINTAISSLATSGGGRLVFPKGTYHFSAAWNSITTNNVVIVGAGDFSGGTVFKFGNGTGNDITFSGCQHSGISGVWFNQTVKKTSGFSIKITGSAFRCFVENVRFDYVYRGIFIETATETRLSGLSFRYLLGPSGITYKGLVGAGSYRCIIDDVQADNPYPQAIGTVKTWAASTAFSLNDIVSVNSIIWQCSVAGTSGSSAPSGIPGTTAPDAFTTAVVDGTCSWKFVSDNSLAWIVQDSYGYSLVIDKAALLNGARGFWQRNSAGGAGYPIWCWAWDLECDHNMFHGVWAEGGEGLYLNSAWLGSCLNGNGIEIDAAHRGEVSIAVGSRIMGNAQHGVLLESGPVDVIVSDSFIGDNSASVANTYHGISVSANTTRFKIVDNKIGDLVGTAGNNQNTGILVSSGTSDRYAIIGNDASGNTTAGINDAGTGSRKIIRDNVGAFAWGTFTPTVTLVGGAGNTVPVYTTNIGRWQGSSEIHVQIKLEGDGGAEGAGTGILNIALPAAGKNVYKSFCGRAWNGAVFYQLNGLIAEGASTVALDYWVTITTVDTVKGSDQSNTTRGIEISFTYEPKVD